MKHLLIFLISLIISIPRTQAQSGKLEDLDQQYLNWYNKDPQSDQILGTSVDRAYNTILENKKTKKTVVVAVIDGGVDIDHEDLQGRIWINPKEIPGNNIDDDNNGYIDDIHGWNFIGNRRGENIVYENFEYTRIVREKDSNHPDYNRSKNLYAEELVKRKTEKANLLKFENLYFKAKFIIKEHTGIDVSTDEDLKDVQPVNPRVKGALKFLKERYAMGFSEESLKEMKENNRNFLDYYLNRDYSVRNLVGDNPDDLSNADYGNPDVKGPRADHGTSVAGVIAAIRNNEIGIDGIAEDVKIMSIRTVPNGDERDKDVALAIRYAVDNGADIINMSFGKKISPQKDFVDEAVRYAEAHDVLLVHGSGNSGENIDIDDSYPSDRLKDGTEAGNWLNVGASNSVLDNELVANFSNYGKNHVDLFAPGVNIISLDSTNSYSMNDGTSLAAPIVSGIAALLLSYNPDLTAKELIEILMNHTHKITRPKKVLQPDLTGAKRKKVRFSELSKSAGIVNAYLALLEVQNRCNQLAELKE